MESQLQHDPRIKSQIKVALFNFLYDPTRAQFQTKLRNLIVRNTVIAKYSHKSFVYKGEFYTADVTPPPRKQNRLVPELVPMMQSYLQELKELEQRELPYTLGFINQVLNTSNSLEDYLKLLPAALHRPIEQFITSCTCTSCSISDDVAMAFQNKNQEVINLIKQRMVKNLII